MNRKRSERREQRTIEEILGINIICPRPLGGGGAGDPPGSSSKMSWYLECVIISTKIK